MKTSTLVYLPYTSRKDTIAAMADAQHQLRLRAERKLAGRTFDFRWAPCRRDPDIYQLSIDIGVCDISLVTECFACVLNPEEYSPRLEMMLIHGWSIVSGPCRNGTWVFERTRLANPSSVFH
jgi:hypothetical protein